MKNKNLLIIGAVLIAAIFFLKRKKKPMPLPEVKNPVNMLPEFLYPKGIFEGMRAQGLDTQYLIMDGKKYGITYGQWEARGFDQGTPIDQSILNLIPDGGILPINLV